MRSSSRGCVPRIHGRPFVAVGSHALGDPFRFEEKMKDVRVSVIHRLICPDIGALWIRMAGWEMLILFSLFFARELNLCKKKNGIEGRRAARVQIALPPIV